MVKKTYPHVYKFVEKKLEKIKKTRHKGEVKLSCGNLVNNLWEIVKKMVVLKEYTN